jgi:hypothetical protein
MSDATFQTRIQKQDGVLGCGECRGAYSGQGASRTDCREDEGTGGVTVKGLLDLSRVPSEPSESKATCCTHGLCYNSLIACM